MATILTMEEVAPFISALAEQVKKGVYDARTQFGVIMELPEEIKIEAMIITKLQAVQLTKTSTRTGNEVQGGGSTEQGVVVGDEKSAGKTTQTSTEEGKDSQTSTDTGTTSSSTSENGNTTVDRSSDIQSTDTRDSNETSEDSTNQDTRQASEENSNSKTDYTYQNK